MRLANVRPIAGIPVGAQPRVGATAAAAVLIRNVDASTSAVITASMTQLAVMTTKQTRLPFSVLTTDIPPPIGLAL
jgi:hypothetical protein